MTLGSYPEGEGAGQSPASTFQPVMKGRLAAVALGACVVGLSLWLGAQVHDHAKEPVYVIPKMGEVVVLAAMIANLASAAASVVLARGWVIFLVGTALLTIFFGILLTLLGVPLLAVGGGLIALAYRLVAKVRGTQRRAIFALGGITALSMALLFMAWNHPPLVDCSTGRVSPSYWYWGGGPSSTSGSSRTTPDGETRGTESFDGKTYSYVCRDGELLEFRTSG